MGDLHSKPVSRYDDRTTANPQSTGRSGAHNAHSEPEPNERIGDPRAKGLLGLGFRPSLAVVLCQKLLHEGVMGLARSPTLPEKAGRFSMRGWRSVRTT